MLDDGFYFVDFGAVGYQKFPAVLTKWTQYSQKPITPDDLSYIVSPDVPCPPLQEIIYVADSMQVFHGLITRVEDKKSSQAVECKSMQWVWRWRAFMAMVYHDASLNAILASGAPTPGTTGTVGALFRLNSEIANGKWIAHSATVAKLVDGGLKSQMGGAALYAYTTFPNAGSIDACDGIVLLSDAGAVPTAAAKYYRTVDDLYVRLGDGSYGPNAFIVAALNKFDSKIRLRDISIGTYKNTSPFVLSGQGDIELDQLFEKTGLIPTFEPWHDGYIYMDLDDDPGRGSETAPVRSFIDGKEGCRVVINDSDYEPGMQAAIGVGSEQSEAPQVVTDWEPSRIQLFKILGVDTTNRAVILQRLQEIIDQNRIGFKITAPVDNFLRVHDWISCTHPILGTFTEKVQKIDIVPGLMTILAGKHVFTPSEAFGEYMRPTIQANAEPLQTTILTDGAGTVTIEKENVDDSLLIYYEESFQTAVDDTAIELGTFCDVKVNGISIPPGRIKLSDGGSIKVDITDHCNKSASVDTNNTISRNMYRATGWSSSESKVTQYKGLKFLEP